jgi:hypothetical protein
LQASTWALSQSKSVCCSPRTLRQQGYKGKRVLDCNGNNSVGRYLRVASKCRCSHQRHLAHQTPPPHLFYHSSSSRAKLMHAMANMVFVVTHMLNRHGDSWRLRTAWRHPDPPLRHEDAHLLRLLEEERGVTRRCLNTLCQPGSERSPYCPTAHAPRPRLTQRLACPSRHHPASGGRGVRVGPVNVRRSL